MMDMFESKSEDDVDCIVGMDRPGLLLEECRLAMATNYISFENTRDEVAFAHQPDTVVNL